MLKKCFAVSLKIAVGMTNIGILTYEVIRKKKKEKNKREINGKKKMDLFDN